MKKFLLLTAIYFGFTPFSWAVNSDLNIHILNSLPQGYEASVKSTYLAETDSDVCKEWVRDGHEVKKVPIRLFGVPASRLPTDSYVAREYLNGKELGQNALCEFKRLNSHLSVSSQEAPEYNVVDIYPGQQDGSLQTVECSKSQFGNQGPFVVCYGDIELSDKLEAFIEIVVSE